MPKGWIETTLAEVTESSWGNTEITKSKYVDSGYLAYSASGADGFLDWFEHDQSAVVLSAIGAQCGKTWYAQGKWTSIKNTIWLKSDNLNLLDKYLFYLSNRDQFWQIRGQAQPFISLGDVKKTKILLPPLPEQKRIVDLISSVDAYIDAIEQQAESARKSRSAVLHEMLSAGGEGWTETTLGEIVTVINGGTPSTKKSEYWDGEITWITTTELTHFDGKVIGNSQRTLTELGLKEGPSKLVEKGTILLGTTATIGTIGFVQEPVAFNQQISGLKLKSDQNDPWFVFYYLQSIKYILENLSAGTSFKRISTSVLTKVPITTPPLDEQKRIVDLISSMDEGISATEKLISETNQLRSGLLADLLSGDHEIPESYDKIIGAA